MAHSYVYVKIVFKKYFGLLVVIMNVIKDYNSYISKIEQGDTQYIFEGELSVLSVVHSEENMLEGSFYVCDDLNDGEQTVLLKVECNSGFLRITEGYCIENLLVYIAQCLDIKNIELAMNWWNLCYYRNRQGMVFYDSFYDGYFLDSESEKKMLDLQEEIKMWVNNLFEGSGGLIYVLGKLVSCNPVIYQLQQRGFEVKTLSIDNLKNESGYIERILHLRKDIVQPYCGTDLINISFFASNKVDNYPARCYCSYLITIPIDLIDIKKDEALGCYIYENVIPNGKFCRDYTCCGNDYSCVEVELFADLHGNTILKVTNSNSESKYTIVNKFNYVNKFNCNYNIKICK